jgi:NAD+ diphosphatase
LVTGASNGKSAGVTGSGFFCDVDGDDTIKMDESELKVAEWRTREEIELQPDDYSLTNEMMRMFKEGKT